MAKFASLKFLLKTTFFLVFSFISAISIAQENLPKEEQLDQVTVSANRIEIPFSEDSRTITVITTEEKSEYKGF